MKMYIVSFLALFCSFSSFAAEMKCQQEWDDLKAIQAKMRAGQNDEYTRKRERQYHDKYQKCRMNKNRVSTSNKKKNNANYSSSTSNKKVYHPPVRNPFKNSSVAVKGRYEGDKQKHWLEFYKIPTECKKPKTTSEFAKCMAHRDEKAKEFDLIWDKGPTSFKLDN